MQRLNSIYLHLLDDVSLDFVRYLYPQINWKNRLIMLKGQKGVGKTTMLLQHIKQTFDDPNSVFYVSADNSWFATHTIVDLADYLVSHGKTHLFLDEVHKYNGWDKQIKEIYDSYPKLKVVVTGSSMLHLDESDADLSRRCRTYTMQGLSFREYLKLEGIVDLPALSLEDILEKHESIAARLTNKLPVLKYFEQYLINGYYPFYKEEGDGFLQRLENVVNVIIQVEIPSVAKVEYESVYKIKVLLGILAQRNPYTLNVQELSSLLGTSRDSVYKMLQLLHRAALIRRLFQKDGGLKLVQKPEKILLDNTNLMYALSESTDAGTMRETFFSSMLSSHKLCMPQQGDLLVDNKYLFEVGGRKKGYKQIADVTDRYVVADGIDVGIGNKIPLWMFGMLY